MGTPADIMDFALTYLRVYMLGTIPSFLYNVGSGILRAVGDTRRPLYFLIIACTVNIALDVVLVAVLGMGVLGAALATIFSRGVSAVLVLVSLTRAETVYRLDWKQVRFHGRLLGIFCAWAYPPGCSRTCTPFPISSFKQPSTASARPQWRPGRRTARWTASSG